MKLKLILFLFFVFSLHVLQAQELAFPPKIDLSLHNSSIIRGRLYGFPAVRMWGWSNNGKAAYSVERHIDGRGGQQINFIILDLITDETVFELKMDSFDHGDTENEALYNLYRSNIANAIRANGIIREGTSFLPFPFTRNNTVYNAHIIDIEYKNDEYGFFDRLVSKYKVSVTANNRRKIISTSVPEKTVAGDVYVCGYFLSPFENRAMVVIAEEAWVFEGTELFYRFAGCHLGVGFN